jgi:NAD-reducing hydrogenase small subunit
LCLVEGAVANHDNLELLRLIRKRTKVIVAFGDCAITGNVTAMRNPMGGEDCVLKRSYLEGGDIRSRVPGDGGVLPPLLDRVEPIHVFVPVDYYLQGCPPSANRIKAMLEEIIEAATPQLTGGNVTFG